MYKNGGYAIVSHDDANIYSKVQGAYLNQKPILFYDDDNTCYFIDTIKKNNDGDYVLTKGGKTFTITDVNSVISEGSVSNPTLETIKDLDGNLRFIEIDGIEPTIEGVTFSYCKASLSGTHLMVVVAGSVDDTTAIANQTRLATFTLPEWIYNKIVTIVDTLINTGTFTMWANDYTTQNLLVNFIKISGKQIALNVGTAITLTADRNFRVQFDLLIDAE